MLYWDTVAREATLHLKGENGLLEKDEIVSDYITDSPPHVTLPNAVDSVDELQIFEVPSPFHAPTMLLTFLMAHSTPSTHRIMGRSVQLRLLVRFSMMLTPVEIFTALSKQQPMYWMKPLMTSTCFSRRLMVEILVFLPRRKLSGTPFPTPTVLPDTSTNCWGVNGLKCLSGDPHR
jgi:hypothetical protein